MTEIPTTIKNKALVERRREQIVLAAIRLFSRNGYYETTLRDLSEEAGISYGNIYDYVGSKKDIFYLIHEYLCDRVFEALQNAIENIEDPVEKLRRMVRAEFNFMDSWSDGIMLLYQEGHVLESPFLQKFLGKEHDHVQMFEQVITECVHKGLLRECNPRVAANSIKMLVDGWVLKRWDLRGHATSQEFERFILDLVLAGLLPGRHRTLSAGVARNYPLSGKNALVIGAETFIGSSVCWALAGAGVRVAAHVNERSPLRKFNPAVQQGTSGGLSFFSSEKFGPPDERLFSSTENEIGPIDIYIHDLGIGCFPGPSSEEMELDTGAFTELMEGNLKWAMEIGRFLIRKISKNQVGKRIIYIAPCGWDRGQDSVGFDTAVAGTIALTENLAAALAPANTNVNCVIPGYIKIYPPSGMKASMPEVIQEKVPECRLGEVSDVTNAVLFLAGDESRYISSQVLRIAG